MNSVAAMRDVGAYLRVLPAFASATFTANSPATGTDGVPQAGLTIDRNDLDSLALSGKLALLLTSASLGGGATATVEITVHDSANGSDWDAVTPKVAHTARVLDDNANYIEEFDIDIAALRRYVRFTVEITFSATATDTVVCSGTFIVTGQRRPQADTAAGGISV